MPDAADSSNTDPSAEHLWPRPAHPVLRKMNPRRIFRRYRTRQAVRLVYYGPPVGEGSADAFRSITFWHRDYQGGPVGKLNFLICHECRRGFIGDLNVQTSLQGHGIATRALAELRKQVPGYTWRTSLHLLSGKSFWTLLAERTGEDYGDVDRTCEHMDLFWGGRGPKQ
ncbi:hypothetical protein H0264_28860 [Nocardia huaxiensis]|uniref:N-acetyltransferase domain-containing protein n=1 Tax=Nocardia huaxiensis TaxID=2755382 RepID=A0A7D6V776_9NOCA|nr:hypothetical protein H0264_28860 [Nocardia huaxiensis]